MTMNEFEKLIYDKDNLILRLETELKAIKEDKDKIYNKLSEKNKIIIELEEKIKMIQLNQVNNYNKTLINKLKEELDSKNEMIEREKEKIEEIKMNFMKQYQDKTLLEDEFEKQKKAYSKEIINPQQPNEDKEKEELKKQILKLKSQIIKMNEERKKLNKTIEDLEQSKNNLNIELAKSQEDKKNILDLQIKDNKKIFQLAD